MSKLWKVLPKNSDDLIEQLLLNRNIKTKLEKESFFNPKLLDYEEDLKISGIEKAKERLQKAISDQELIVIYGDYDVDGLCASTIAYLGLASLGAKVLPYIPHREKEGYGLSKKGLEKIKEMGGELVLTVDNGIVALAQTEYAKEIGLELIITDHHEPLDKLPDALAIVHTTLLSGAGVCWCLMRELVTKELARELLQFVAIATIADLIPVLNINRAILIEGLRELNKTENVGLLSLISEAGLGVGNLGSYEIGHIIGPRLNAIGRLEHAIDGLRLLCTKDVKKARDLARLLCEVNIKRQQLTIDGIDGARLMMNGDGLVKDKKIFVLGSNEWLPGVIGLIASKVCEEYGRPVIAISIGEEFSKGSARSVSGVNIVEVLRNCSEMLVDIGGHSKAAGFSIETKKIEEFKKKIESLSLDLPKLEQIIEIEAEIESKDISRSLVLEIEKFGPFGLGNQRPVLASRRMRLKDIRAVGEGRHLKLKADGIDGIGFGMGGMVSVLKEGQLVEIAYLLDINKFNGQEILQLKVKDIRVED